MISYLVSFNVSESNTNASSGKDDLNSDNEQHDSEQDNEEPPNMVAETAHQDKG